MGKKVTLEDGTEVRIRPLDPDRGEKVKLKDGTEVNIRPLERGDADRSRVFFLNLPEEDRAYLRVDVTDKDFVRRRYDAMASGKIVRLIAEVDGEIIADGSLTRDRLLSAGYSLWAIRKIEI